MSFPRYPEYKDSGVEWLGEVPAHWTVDRFKRLLRCNDGGVWGAEPDGDDDTVVLRSTEQTVDGRWSIEDPALRKLTPAEKESATLVEGDLLVTKSSGSSLHIGKTTLVDAAIAKRGCCYSNFMQRISVTVPSCPRLVWYVLNNEIARTQFDLLSNSTTGLANLNGTVIGELVLTMAPPEEQLAIVAFLDRETAKIDALVAEQEKLIALLKEKRQALISLAVTKGLNPDAPMKDSGIEWLGEVPAHWRLCRVKHLSTSIEQGWSPQCENFPADGDEWAVLKVGCVNGGRFIRQENKVLPEELAPIPELSLKAGDLLISRANTRELVGSAAVVPVDESRLLLCDKLYRLRFDTDVVRAEFIARFLATPSARGQIELDATGASASMVNIGQGTILEMPVAIPPIGEQRKILASLATETYKFDSLIAEAERVITLLKNRRSALISAAVTGKICVLDS